MTRAVITAVLLTCFLAAAAASAEPAELLSRTPYAPGALVPRVQDECSLDTQIPTTLAAATGELRTVEKLGKGRRLELTIQDVHAPGGGAFSGPKWVTLRGELRDGDKLLGSFVAKRQTVFGGGTCGMLQKVIDAIAGDVAAWLAAPSTDARLGNAL